MNGTDELLSYGVAEIIEADALQQRLSAKKSLTVKLGVDPTSQDLHLGHAVVLRKLRQFQDLGHQAVLVIGDFTSKIGDPSGRNATRPVLTDEEIATNMATYVEQAKIILDEKKTKIVHNSTWLAKMTLTDLLGYAMQINVNTLLEREDFHGRLKNQQSLGLHELLYPLTQAIDSVELKADVEIGGWDQRLNLLLGRELQKKLGQPPQEVVIVKALIGLDGERKMSKSLGNYIGLTESPDQVFGKVMSIPDKLTDQYAELAALMKAAEIKALPTHPKDRKAVVAKAITALYHGEAEASAAAERFDKTFSQKQGGQDLADAVVLPGFEIALLEAVKQAAQVSGSEAARLIAQRGVKLDGTICEDPDLLIDVTKKSYQLQVGKHRFYELTKED